MHAQWVLRSEFRLLFRARVKGIKFYDVPVGYVKEEFRFRCVQSSWNCFNDEVVWK